MSKYSELLLCCGLPKQNLAFLGTITNTNRARIELILPICVGVIGTQLSSSVTEVDRCISIACHPGVYQYTCDY